MERLVLTERCTVAGIPALHVRPRGHEGRAPTILFFHGWSSRKELVLVPAEVLAIEGYRVIIPDSINHGERGALPVYDDKSAYHHFYETILQTVSEAGPLAEAAVAAGWADPDRMGVLGNSMGGFIAAGVMARYDWPKAAVLFNGCPCYAWVDEFYHRATGTPVPAGRLERLRSHDPEGLVARIAPRPFLMLHGSADQVVPIEGARRFLELARPHYAALPDRLALVEQDRLNHYVTMFMVEKMRDWFCRYLPCS
ncbi:MAG TPA: alpha/beta fold hydrolase [Symbiobacteriaceae bacterium]|nr:alpha/beta fold hydrolase [Symbiobacteriaceae bacterium]